VATIPRALPAQPAIAKHRYEGQFLFEAAGKSDVFTPEDFSDEHRMIADAARAFFEREVAPAERLIEQQHYELVRGLIGRAGEAGFLSTGVPESDGGFGLGLVPTMIEVEEFSRNASFTMAIATQTGIGILPLLFYGTPAQKRRYLPEILAGKVVLAFALSEGHSGSDALTPRTTARLDEAGRHYILSGEKMWVTNAGIADLFTVFGRVEGGGLAAFLVERAWPGVTLGAEEIKLGAHGSSTRTLVLDRVPVPVENLLGEVGHGSRVMFGTLNIGRARLGAGLVGASKTVLHLAAQYAADRCAFGKPIARYGLIQQKLADIAAKIYAAESMAYRLAGLLAPQVKEAEQHGIDTIPGGIGFVIECSALKIFGSELYSYAADEGVQIHGGNGYSAAYPIERHFRDARLTRIFEGTNEIHRLLMIERLIKLSMSGTLPLFNTAATVQAELPHAPRRRGSLKGNSPPVIGNEAGLVDRMRRLGVLLTASALDRYKSEIQEQQVLIGALADVVTETFAADSAVARSLRVTRELGDYDNWPVREQVRGAATALFVNDAFERALLAARKAAGVISHGAHGALHNLVDRLSVYPAVDRGELSERISNAVTESHGYVF
jgi:alkylation response protein AidB-like acyl-CoA dehydrogenase